MARNKNDAKVTAELDALRAARSELYAAMQTEMSAVLAGEPSDSDMARLDAIEASYRARIDAL